MSLLARNVREARKQEFKWVIASPGKPGPFNKEDKNNGYWVTNSSITTGVINFLNQYNLVIGRKKEKWLYWVEKVPGDIQVGTGQIEYLNEGRWNLVILPSVARFSHQLCTLRALDFIYYQQFRSLILSHFPLFQRKKELLPIEVTLAGCRVDQITSTPTASL